jgi:hypothetical protein
MPSSMDIYLPFQNPLLDCYWDLVQNNCLAKFLCDLPNMNQMLSDPPSHVALHHQNGMKS